MKIIKSVDFNNKYANDVITKIAKYMINIMAHADIFDENYEFNPKAITTGFPIIEIDETKYFTRASIATIFYSGLNFNELEFEKCLINKLKELENTYNLSKFYNNSDGYLNNYQSIFNSIHTNIKIKSHLEKIKKIKDISENYTQFQFSTDVLFYTLKPSRFTWNIINIRKYNFDIGGHSGEYIITNRISSIFYDDAKLSNIKDGTFLLDFSKSDLMGYSNVINHNAIFISEYVNNIAFYINSYWTKCLEKKQDINEKYMYRPLKSDVYAFDFHKDFTNSEGNYNCEYCKNTLYDDNYVLYNRIKHVDDSLGINKKLVLCPLCMHLSPDGLEPLYRLILRVKFPTTLEQIIETRNFDSDTKKLLTTLYRCDKIQNKQNKTKDITKKSLIFSGDNSLLGFFKIDDYLFDYSEETSKSTLALFNEKKIIHIR